MIVIGLRLNLKRIHEAAEKVWHAKSPGWPQAESDAANLSTLVQVLVHKVHHLNNQLPDDKREILCPMCAGSYFGRPQHPKGGMDFTKRSCSTCGTIFDEPPQPEPGYRDPG